MALLPCLDVACYQPCPCLLKDAYDRDKRSAGLHWQIADDTTPLAISVEMTEQQRYDGSTGSENA